jgi:hypothetical protein
VAHTWAYAYTPKQLVGGCVNRVDEHAHRLVEIARLNVRDVTWPTLTHHVDRLAQHTYTLASLLTKYRIR